MTPSNTGWREQDDAGAAPLRMKYPIVGHAKRAPRRRDVTPFHRTAPGASQGQRWPGRNRLLTILVALRGKKRRTRRGREAFGTEKQAMQSAGSDWVATAGARYVGADSRPPDLVRVLHVVNGEHYAGAERVQDHLALRLPEQGYEVGFACLKPGRFAAMRQSRKSALHDTLMRGRFDLRWASRLADLVRREGYSMIHTHSPRGIMIGSLAAAMARVPLVHHAHFPTLLEIGPRWLRRVGDAVERLGLRRAAGVIAVSGQCGPVPASPRLCRAPDLAGAQRGPHAGRLAAATDQRGMLGAGHRGTASAAQRRGDLVGRLGPAARAGNSVAAARRGAFRDPGV